VITINVHSEKMPVQTDSPDQAGQARPSDDSSFVVADIGGTNARFAIFTPDESGTIHHHDRRRFRCKDFNDLSEAITTYLEEIGRDVDGACISIAAPADGDRISMTNLDWSFSIREYKQALGLKNLLVINDGVAAALATTCVESSQLENIKAGEVEAHGSRLNLIPGTGFGLGCIIPQNGGWIPVQSEGGHATCAAVTAEEFEVLKTITQQSGRAVNDKVLSGPGMFNIYQSLAVVRGQKPLDVDAKEMTRKALEQEDQLCEDALDLYCTLFGRLAGDLALTLNAHGGIYLSGSLMQRIGANRISKGFLKGFLDKGRMTDKVMRIPVNLLRLRNQCLYGASVWVNAQITAGDVF
jgi:glucokinase